MSVDGRKLSERMLEKELMFDVKVRPLYMLYCMEVKSFEARAEKAEEILNDEYNAVLDLADRLNKAESRLAEAQKSINTIIAVMDHSFGEGWRNPDFLSVDYGANDSVDGMQDMARVLRESVLGVVAQGEKGG